MTTHHRDHHHRDHPHQPEVQPPEPSIPHADVVRIGELAQLIKERTRDEPYHGGTVPILCDEIIELVNKTGKPLTLVD